MSPSSLAVILLAVLAVYAISISWCAYLMPPVRLYRHLVSFTLGLLVALANFVPSPDLSRWIRMNSNGSFCPHL